ncbi:hypothetical protein EDB86DRAFT_2826588 [Lactarius hatsudake]|nr:hypothetical protein EDB86DRAFT_2826588 [Lactarius hatsudake]
MLGSTILRTYHSVCLTVTSQTYIFLSEIGEQGEVAKDHGGSLLVSREPSKVTRCVAAEWGSRRGKEVGPGEGTATSCNECVGVCRPAEGRDACWIAREAPTSMVRLRGGPLGVPMGDVTEGVLERRGYGVGTEARCAPLARRTSMSGGRGRGDVHESQYYRQRDSPANRTEHDRDDVRGRRRARSRCRGPCRRGSGDLGWMIASGGGAVSGSSGEDGEGRGEGEGSDVCFHGGPGGAMRSAASAEAREGAPAARCETRARGGGRERDHRLRWWRVEREGREEKDESAGSGWGGSALDD